MSILGVLREKTSGLFSRRRRTCPIPPPELDFVGGINFSKIGEEFKNYFIELGGLTPDAAVLDVGCGIGRMAIPLTTYLSRNGRYRGFDIVKQGITWCRENITPLFPNFRFEWADIYSKRYNPTARCQPAEYEFPYRDARFDFAFLTSVFTHMLPVDLEHYLAEVSRVLRPGGRCFITYFLTNAEVHKLIAADRSHLKFVHKIGECLTTNKDCPEEAIAHDVNAIRDLYARYHLRMHEPVYYGGWCGRDRALTYQDIVVATKE